MKWGKVIRLTGLLAGFGALLVGCEPSNDYASAGQLAMQGKDGSGNQVCPVGDILIGVGNLGRICVKYTLPDPLGSQQ